MTISRYGARELTTNDDKGYQEDILERRGIKKMVHFTTPTLRYPTSDEVASLDIRAFTWKRGSSLSKIAAIEYGDATLWWVLAWYNKKPTDAHCNLGDIVFVPKPLDRIITQFRV